MISAWTSRPAPLQCSNRLPMPSCATLARWKRIARVAGKSGRGGSTALLLFARLPAGISVQPTGLPDWTFQRICRSSGRLMPALSILSQLEGGRGATQKL